MVARRAADGSAMINSMQKGECMWLIDIVVLGARLGALPWGRAPILDPLHRRANLVCSPNVINSRVAALNRNCTAKRAGPSIHI